MLAMRNARSRSVGFSALLKIRGIGAKGVYVEAVARFKF